MTRKIKAGDEVGLQSTSEDETRDVRGLLEPAINLREHLRDISDSHTQMATRSPNTTYPLKSKRPEVYRLGLLVDPNLQGSQHRKTQNQGAASRRFGN